MEAIAEHAGFFAAQGIWCVSEGGPLVPMLTFERPNGSREVVRFDAELLEDGLEQGRDWLAKNSEGATHAVLVFDAFIRLGAGKCDALIIEAVQYVPERLAFTIAVPYRNQESGEGFAVHRVKFLGFEGGKLDFDNLCDAFFRGVDQHEKGAQVWNASLDQSR